MKTVSLGNLAINAAGIVCPECGVRCSVTRTIRLKQKIIRYHKCQKCGRSFPTEETYRYPVRDGDG